MYYECRVSQGYQEYRDTRYTRDTRNIMDIRIHPDTPPSRYQVYQGFFISYKEYEFLNNREVDMLLITRDNFYKENYFL